MKIVKGSILQFIGLFGEEGVALMKDCPELVIIFAETGDYPECDLHPPALVVTHIKSDYSAITHNPEDDLALIVYPDGVKDVVNRVARELRERYRTSLLVHELTHVQQVQEGRLVTVNLEQNIWEGELVTVNMVNYFSLPWEKEAFMKQYIYLFYGDEAVAQTLVDEQCKQLVQT